MITLRVGKKIGALGAIALMLGVISTSVNANTITMENYGGLGVDGEVSCTTSCLGFIGTLTVSLSNTTAQDYPKEGSPAAELAALNALLAALDPARPAVTGVNKTDVAGSGFTTSLQYFSIKQKDHLWFFENTSGGSLTVALGSESEDYSHWTEYGPASVVPVPAAVWLFGTALLGFIGISRRTKV